MTWHTLLPEIVVKYWDDFARKVENALIYFMPAYVSKKSFLFSPLIAVIAIIMATITPDTCCPAAANWLQGVP